MPTTSKSATLLLTLPEHVITILDGWAASYVEATPEEVLEALAESLCTNEYLRQYAARLVAQGWYAPGAGLEGLRVEHPVRAGVDHSGAGGVPASLTGRSPVDTEEVRDQLDLSPDSISDHIALTEVAEDGDVVVLAGVGEAVHVLGLEDWTIEQPFR